MSEQVNEQEVIKKITLLMEGLHKHQARAGAFRESADHMNDAAARLTEKAHAELDKGEELHKEARRLLESIGG